MKALILALLSLPGVVLAQPYNTSDLLSFLSFYGAETVDVVPDFVNYYQDIGPAHVYAQLDNLTQPLPENSTCDWFINGQYVFTGEDLMLLEISPLLECEGVVELTLRVIDEDTGAVYERTKWAMIEYTFMQDWCSCTNCPNYWDVWPVEPPIQPYQFLVESSTWDLDGDLHVGVSDLLTLLNYYSN